MVRFLGIACLAFLAAVRSSSAEPAPTRIPDFTLNDSLGALRSLSEWQDSPAVVVVFLGTECPLAKLYAQRLTELEQRYRDEGVAFLGINPNDHDTLLEIAGYVRKHKVSFPILKDPGQKVADLFGATRTPMAFLLDEQRRIRYRGRIDDQYGIGYARPDAKVSYLANAIRQLLAGEPVDESETRPVGCVIGRLRNTVPTGDITYCDQVVRILNQHCVRCHREGQIAPFALTEYEDVVAWSGMMLEVIDEGRMPPWHANPDHGQFANDAHLPASDKRLFAQWCENGTPEGDRSDLPPPPEFTEGWRIPKPDIVLGMPKPYRIPAKGVVPYQYFEIGPGFKKDRWVKASEIRPGNPAIVHHAFAFFLPPGRSLRAEDPLINAVASFAPGMPATLWPEGHARLVPAGSRLLLQMHYTPNGSDQLDQTRVGLSFAGEEEVEKEVRFGIAVNVDFRIPPHTAEQRVRAGYQFTQDTLVHSLIPHMHYRGKSFRFTVRYPDGKHEVLLDVPRYDFNWQNAYQLKEAKLMPENSVLLCEGVFDNSADNPANPDPDREVRWGDQSTDEMMLGSFTTSLPDWIKTGEYPKAESLEGGGYRVTFRCLPENKQTKTVAVAGTFNDWDRTENLLKGPDGKGYFRGTLVIPAGLHEYKFVLDGKHWIHDPENPDRTGPFTNSALRLRGE